MTVKPIINVTTKNPFYTPTILDRHRLFIPSGVPKVITVGTARRNPAAWGKREASDYAALFVGLDATRGSAAWPEGSKIPGRVLTDDVARFRKDTAKAGGVSVIAQSGRYRDPEGKIRPERSVQVLIMREDGEAFASFAQNVKKLALFLVDKYGQYVVYVDFVRHGRVVRFRKAFWKGKK